MSHEKSMQQNCKPVETAAHTHWSLMAHVWQARANRYVLADRARTQGADQSGQLGGRHRAVGASIIRK